MNTKSLIYQYKSERVYCVCVLLYGLSNCYRVSTEIITNRFISRFSFSIFRIHVEQIPKNNICCYIYMDILSSCHEKPFKNVGTVSLVIFYERLG